ncbi:MAG: dihydroorotate dehydrogenase-like protein [Bacteroidales bacterium]|jgi:dihydroorotate dehydrogenase (fumarate)|nr:dihydroorotate dehydrogenase-like protein [Bacteroidales bacterium]MBO7255760.1 dihydroorotate dehydrogenase-like protein [Bacteroidales bacterium]MBO7284091.1 dihydroorotate dehydrogenase-like protein [Bacteroidales bacterium]MBO7322201.1 dihydroorotate dehydrogenase-like protein [Bacteroidales bacterium]MBQ5881910.1 dihydroorotate dehydrogenase-like protein [Bacteroidales bacterium]
MSNLSVKYLGLDLSSPIIASSCGLTADLQKVIEMEQKGVGAIVVKSLFEEQIRNEVEFLSEAGHDYPDMDDYLHNYVRQYSINNYKEALRSFKQHLTIPVIASINCYTLGEWVHYAKEIEDAGADALEINLYELTTNPQTTSEQVEKGYCDVVREIVKNVNIPVSVKISSHFTSVVSFVDKMVACGVKGVVIFNRFYTPDIDLDTLSIVPASPMSSPEEYLQTLRWTAIISSSVKNIDISVTTGVHTPDSAIKQILAGAETVQLCTTLYKNGLGMISTMNEEILQFMDKNNFASISQMRGRLNYSTIKDPAKYERVQFLKTFGGVKK